MRYFLGCDPGWTNLAYAIIDDNLKLIKTGCIIPKELGGAIAPNEISNYLSKHCIKATFKDLMAGAVMERFVYFDGVHNPNSEHILMVTGQMQFMLNDHWGITPTMFRSFDWKSRLSKHLFKQGFRNPSKDKRLDKEFSIGAAEFIFNCKFKTDHEADAACMAYIAKLLAGDEGT